MKTGVFNSEDVVDGHILNWNSWNGLNGIDVESILVTDMEGKVLESYENVIGPALDMDIDYLQSGMYFVTINYNGTSEVVKFIKE